MKPLDGPSARAQELLRQWDGRMDRELPQPLIYTQVKVCLLGRVSAALFGELAGAPGSEAHLRQLELELVLALEKGAEALLPAGQHWPDLLAESLQEAVTLLQKKLGPEPGAWRWGQVHHTQPRHPLSIISPFA